MLSNCVKHDYISMMFIKKIRDMYVCIREHTVQIIKIKNKKTTRPGQEFIYFFAFHFSIRNKACILNCFFENKFEKNLNRLKVGCSLIVFAFQIILNINI